MIVYLIKNCRKNCIPHSIYEWFWPTRGSAIKSVGVSHQVGSRSECKSVPADSAL